MRHIESKRIAICNYKDLHFLATPGFCWAKEGLDKIITVVAIVGEVNDWAAYHETPQTGSDKYSVLTIGDKLSQEVASLIFPEWAKKYEWRH